MKTRIVQPVFQILLLILIAGGIFLRFYNLEWDSGALLHPDEYGLTNTLTRLSIPRSLTEYFNTRESPLSPYDKYDLAGEKTENGPDNRMRWGQLPIFIIRIVAEALGRTGYLEMRLTGRALSALADVGSMFLLFLIALRLLRHPTAALLAAVFYGYAVMAIQQSHFMTVDNFAVFFIMCTLYAAVRISQTEIFLITDSGTLQPGRKAVKWFVLFGVFLGMAVACKINQAVLGVVLPLALFIAVADYRIASRSAFWRVFWQGLGLCVLSALTALIVFRLLQPMSFRAPGGNTGLFTFHFNKDWLDSMLVSAAESSGIGGGPPSEQWAHRTPIIFPLVNMVLYGMGLPLGLAVWTAAAAAYWKCVQSDRQEWKILLIPLFWSLFYFLFMGTRFVKSIRYMLPIYPMLCLLLAWALCRLAGSASRRQQWVGVVLTGLVLISGAVWPLLFSHTIYGQPHSRVEAVNWIYDNIPAAIQLEGAADAAGTVRRIRLSPPDPLIISPGMPFDIMFRSTENLLLQRLIIPHAAAMNAGSSIQLKIEIKDSSNEVISSFDYEGETDQDQSIEIAIPDPVVLLPDLDYSLSLTSRSEAAVQIRRVILANESWDEGLPFPLHGLDPFGQLYKGITSEVRWADNEHKKKMLISVLDQADFILVPSQRSVWSAARIPLTYPMTLDYYQALFDGSLGFDLAAQFQRPFRLGSLFFSDLAGAIEIGSSPILPVKNLSRTAAEEAFSVYDHPPVWIFRKSDRYDSAAAMEILNRADLSGVQIQGPRDAVWPEGYAGDR